MEPQVRYTAPPVLPNQSTPIKPTGRGIGIDIWDINNMTHNKIDASEKKSMNSFLVENVVSLADVLLPDAALGFDVYQLLEDMKDNGTYDVSKTWKGWPEELLPGREPEMNKFLEGIRTAMDMALRNSANSTSPHPEMLRFISCATHKKALTGELAKRFPDHVFLKLLTDLLTLGWSQVEATLELKYCNSDGLLRRAKNQLWQIAKFIFRNQHNRRFVLGVMLLGSTMYLMYIDRSGVLISSSFDIHTEPLQFLRVLGGLVYADDKYLGYDTTFSFDTTTSVKDGIPTSATLNGVKYSVKDVVHAETGILGRGTVCLEVMDDSSSTTYALKDAWVDVTRAQKEAQILSDLNALNITNIPILVHHEIVQVDGVNDSTQNIRDALDEKVWTMKPTKQPHSLFASPLEGQEVKDEENQSEAKAVNPNAAPAGEQAQDEDEAIKLFKWKRAQLLKYFAREHYRLLIWPFGRPLTAFRCLEELLLGIRDIIGVIQQLRNAGYLHRDISINNVVLADNDKELVELLKSQGINCHSSISAESPQGEGEDPILVEETANNDEGDNNIDENRNFITNDLHAAAESKTSLSEDVRKRLEGFLIDFDYSIFIDREDDSALADRTGTVPFMAIEVLKASKLKLKHTYYHDLESLFYVLCWVCTVSAGPGISRPSKEYPDSIVRKWNEEEPSEEGMKRVAESKQVNTQDDESFEDILEHCHEYFKPIFGCLLGLRRCLFPTRQSDKRTYDEFQESYDHYAQMTDRSKFDLKELKRRRHRLPLIRRDRNDVFQDLYDVIDEAVAALPAEHKLDALKDLPADKGTARKSRRNNHSTTACTTEDMDGFMAVQSEDVLTDLPKFSTRPKSRHQFDAVPNMKKSSDPAGPQVPGSSGSKRSCRDKRKSYEEDTDDDETTNASSSSRKKLKVVAVKAKSESAAVPVVRKSKQQRHDEAEFVPGS